MQLYAMYGAAEGCSSGNTLTTLHPSSSRLGDKVDAHVAKALAAEYDIQLSARRVAKVEAIPL